MVKRGRKRGTSTFSLKGLDGAGRVSLAGDFTDWQPVAMRKRSGAFSVTLALPPGRHEYKFIVDGTWRTDPDHSNWAVNAYDTLNSLVPAEAEWPGGDVPGNT